MSALDSVRLIIYRCHEQGLEIFMIREGEEDLWQLPSGAIKAIRSKDGRQIIELDSIQNASGTIRTIAIEADWHEIPSIRGLIKHDLSVVKHKIKEHIPGLDRGAFVAVKEAFKTVLPEEYEALKELKEVLIDKNLGLSI